MNSRALAPVTMADLAQVPGKAELIGGRIVHLMPTGRRPNRVAAKIFRALDDYAVSTGLGEAYTDNMGFAVAELSSGRQSFSPGASWFSGPFTDDDMGFIDGPPTVAVEVRSESDVGPAAELEMAHKRVDYFEAGTRIVWDVDPVAEQIHVYTGSSSDQPETFRRGGSAHAEPALPGWRLPVDSVFD